MLERRLRSEAQKRKVFGEQYSHTPELLSDFFRN